MPNDNKTNNNNNNKITNTNTTTTTSNTTITTTSSNTTSTINNNNNNNNIIKYNIDNNIMDNLETKYYLELVFISVLLESSWRFYHCYDYIMIKIMNIITLKHMNLIFLPCFQFILSYILCILTIWLGIKKWNLCKNKLIRDFLTILYGLDGIAALILGYSIYIKNNYLIFLTILISTKVFLLHFLSRMVTGLHAYTNNAIALQTTKTFLHHLGSFFFISSYYSKIIFITSIWRFISLSGHSLLSITHLLNSNTYYKLSWLLIHLRNIAIIITFILILIFHDIRRGFALSAVGHIAYIGVRAGAIFRLGGPYIEDKNEGNDNDIINVYI